MAPGRGERARAGISGEGRAAGAALAEQLCCLLSRETAARRGTAAQVGSYLALVAVMLAGAAAGDLRSRLDRAAGLGTAGPAPPVVGGWLG